MNSELFELLSGNKSHIVSRTRPDQLKTTRAVLIPDTSRFKCAVKLCRNYFNNFNQFKSTGFKFYNFPENPKLNKLWKQFCDIGPEEQDRVLRICSHHFTDDDISDGILKSDAVPSICLERKLYEAKVRALEAEIVDLKANIGCKKRLLDKKKNTLISLSLTTNAARKKAKCFSEKTIRSFFSDSQIKVLQGQKKVYWTNDDLAQAFTLRHMGGKEFYLYLRNTLNYPLPALSTIQAWAGN